MPFQIFWRRIYPAIRSEKNSHSDGANLVDCDRFVGFTSSVYVILICRLVLGITEGIYWPQQSRFASDWFSDKERTQANSIIQYYGQFGIRHGIYDFVPAGCCLRLAKCFIITGVIGIVVVVPLYITMLKTGRSALLSCTGANREN